MRILLFALLSACASTRGSDTTVIVVSDAKPAAATVDDAPCDTDADCAFTRVGPGENACCPMLCTPRVVTKKRAQALDDRIATCSGGRECPLPVCRAPLRQVTLKCEASKCVGKETQGSMQN
jgi:hypothetical protein